MMALSYLKRFGAKGPGDVFGVRQHGIPEMKIANLYMDLDILTDVQKTVKQIMDRDLLETDEYKPLKEKVEQLMAERFKEVSLN